MKTIIFKVLDYGAITTPAGMSFSRRLELIYDEAELLMKRYSPQAMSIEKLFFNSNAKNSHRCWPSAWRFDARGAKVRPGGL